jgi:hypothetical protein
MEPTLAPSERARAPVGLQRQAGQPGLLAAPPLARQVRRAPGQLLDAGARAFDVDFTNDGQATPETSALSDLELLNNADSYGCLVQTLG